MMQFARFYFLPSFTPTQLLREGRWQLCAQRMQPPAIILMEAGQHMGPDLHSDLGVTLSPGLPPYPAQGSGMRQAYPPLRTSRQQWDLTRSRLRQGPTLKGPGVMQSYLLLNVVTDVAIMWPVLRSHSTK
jgi:hypothetical protein